MNNELEELRRELIVFRDSRDWKRFHDPKNIAEAISIEASELLEIFLWKTTDGSKHPSTEELDCIKNEVADIFIYLIYICQELNISLVEVVKQKIILNEEKYPIDKAKKPNTGK